MKAVVLPRCPYCKAEYKWHDEENEPLQRLKNHNSPVLVKCQRCRERYYVGVQKRYISRRLAGC